MKTGGPVGKEAQSSWSKARRDTSDIKPLALTPPFDSVALMPGPRTPVSVHLKESFFAFIKHLGVGQGSRHPTLRIEFLQLNSSI
jgi:hypothetical protein